MSSWVTLLVFRVCVCVCELKIAWQDDEEKRENILYTRHVFVFSLHTHLKTEELFLKFETSTGGVEFVLSACSNFNRANGNG